MRSPSDAIQWNFSAADKARLSSNKLLLSQVLALRGRIYLSYEEPKAAQACLEESLALAKEVDDLQGFAVTSVTIAASALQQGDPAGAERHARVVIRIAEHYEDFELQARGLSVLAMAHEDMGDTDQAIAEWERLRHLFEEIGDMDGVQRAESYASALVAQREARRKDQNGNVDDRTVASAPPVQSKKHYPDSNSDSEDLWFERQQIESLSGWATFSSQLRDEASRSQVGLLLQRLARLLRRISKEDSDVVLFQEDVDLLLSLAQMADRRNSVERSLRVRFLRSLMPYIESEKEPERWALLNTDFALTLAEGSDGSLPDLWHRTIEALEESARVLRDHGYEEEWAATQLTLGRVYADHCFGGSGGRSACSDWLLEFGAHGSRESAVPNSGLQCASQLRRRISRCKTGDA